MLPASSTYRPVDPETFGGKLRVEGRKAVKLSADPLYFTQGFAAHISQGMTLRESRFSGELFYLSTRFARLL